MRYSSSTNSTEEYLKSIDEESLHMLADYVLARHGIEAFKNLITLLPPHLRRLLELTIDPCGPQVDLVNEILAMSPVRH